MNPWTLAYEGLPLTFITPRCLRWAGGERELYIRIIPHRVTGRRINAL